MSSVHILLDRSGSMSVRMQACLKTINEFAASLPSETMISVYAFDSNGHIAWQNQAALNLYRRDAQLPSPLTFDTVRHQSQAGGAFKPIEYHEVSPRGGTPLFDAIGRLASIVAQDKAERGVVMILTDGEENESREVKGVTAQTLLDQIRARGWEVNQVGIEFRDVYAQAAGLGTQAHNTVSMTAQAMNSGVAAQNLAANTMNYLSTGVSRGFTAEQKAALEK
jgi:von Willebrand factor type A domain